MGRRAFPRGKVYGLFVVEGVRAWLDPARKGPRILHHRGRFMVAGKTARLSSKME